MIASSFSFFWWPLLRDGIIFLSYSHSSTVCRFLLLVLYGHTVYRWMRRKENVSTCDLKPALIKKERKLCRSNHFFFQEEIGTSSFLFLFYIRAGRRDRVCNINSFSLFCPSAGSSFPLIEFLWASIMMDRMKRNLLDTISWSAEASLSLSSVDGVLSLYWPSTDLWKRRSF